MYSFKGHVYNVIRVGETSQDQKVCRRNVCAPFCLTVLTEGLWTYYITLHYIRKLYSGLSKSNFKDHYGDAVIKQCLSKIAEINEFSAFDEML